MTSEVKDITAAHSNKIRWIQATLLLLLILWQLQRSLPYPQLADLGSFIASGRAAGQGLNPYAIYPLSFHVVLPGFSTWNPNLNPPVSLPFFELLGSMDPYRAYRLWWSFNFLCYIGLIVLLVRHYHPKQPWLPALCAFAAAGFWDTLLLGQIYVALAFISAIAWLLLEKDRPLMAGIVIGFVVANKPNFIVWPCLLLFSRHVRAAIAGFISAALFTALPLLRYGPGVYKQWVTVVTQHPNDHLDFLSNGSIPALIQRLGIAPSFAMAACAIFLLALAGWAWYSRPDVLRVSALGLVASLLASPLGWVHYTLFLLPVFLYLPATPVLGVVVVLLIIPVSKIIDTFITAPAWQQATFGSVYAWALILLLIYLWTLPQNGKIAPSEKQLLSG
jgi:hypothetical protein